MSVPALRFKQDDGRDFPDWEESKLGEISSFFSGGTPLTTNSDFYGGEIPFIKSGEISDNKTAQFITESGLKNSSAKMVLKGDLLYALYGATSGEVAISKIEGAINQAVLCIRSKLNTYFLLSYFLFEKQNILQTYLQGGQGNLSAEIIKSLVVPVPSANEQTKIANFLTTVDEKISLLTQKYDLLTQYKKGVMQQIFSQELRFKDDDGGDFPEWENVELGDVFDYKNGKSLETDVVEDGEFFLITLNSIDISGKLKQDHKRVAKNDDSLIKDDLIMVLSDVAHGNFLGLTDVIPNDMYVLNQRMGGLRAKKPINVRYASLFINYSQKYFKLHGQGSSQLNLSKGDVLAFDLPTPSLKEQIKIANFLTVIDDKITATQTQLQAVKQYKQGLLQQMFV